MSYQNLQDIVNNDKQMHKSLSRGKHDDDFGKKEVGLKRDGGFGRDGDGFGFGGGLGFKKTKSFDSNLHKLGNE